MMAVKSTTEAQVMLKRPADNNRHIKEYLSQYIAFPHSPRFAVMLTGPWGIGKTFLVKKFIENELKKGQKHVYVSLYGLTSPDEIDAALFRFIYPILDSKFTAIGSRLLKTAMNYARINLEVKASDVLSKFNAGLYVFDDLERCDMPINKVLGYINEFVEHDGCKVIIIANESEIEKKDDYLRRREKIIGKTLEVQSVFDEALDNFIASVDDKPTNAFLRSCLIEISSLYYQSELNNLRILQQAIWDFERLYSVLLPAHRDNHRAMSALLKLFLALMT
jgi:AAA+ ATPase superfamily predicted ATPase